jgi:hypothetical protein
LIFVISDFRNRKREVGSLGKSSWAGEIVWVNHIGEGTDMILASSRAGPLFSSKMTLEKWIL